MVRSLSLCFASTVLDRKMSLDYLDRVVVTDDGQEEGKDLQKSWLVNLVAPSFFAAQMRFECEVKMKKKS